MAEDKQVKYLAKACKRREEIYANYTTRTSTTSSSSFASFGHYIDVSIKEGGTKEKKNLGCRGAADINQRV